MVAVHSSAQAMASELKSKLGVDESTHTRDTASFSSSGVPQLPPFPGDDFHAHDGVILRSGAEAD